MFVIYFYPNKIRIPAKSSGYDFLTPRGYGYGYDFWKWVQVRGWLYPPYCQL